MFIQPCFIRKNTPELRNKLEELGYKYSGCDTSYGTLYNLYCSFDSYYELSGPAQPSRYESIIDCGTNEELFLALVALRNNTNYMQWFTNNNNYWYKCFDNNFIKETADRILLPDADKWHKATVEELIEHFK